MIYMKQLLSPGDDFMACRSTGLVKIYYAIAKMLLDRPVLRREPIAGVSLLFNLCEKLTLMF